MSERLLAVLGVSGIVAGGLVIAGSRQPRERVEVAELAIDGSSAFPVTASVEAGFIAEARVTNRTARWGTFGAEFLFPGPRTMLRLGEPAPLSPGSSIIFMLVFTPTTLEGPLWPGIYDMAVSVYEVTEPAKNLAQRTKLGALVLL